MRKPIIGITPSPSSDQFDHGTFNRWALSRNYSEAVEAAGGIPVILPPQDGNVSALLDVLDGVLLSGGGDIRPSVYGDDTVHPTTYGINDARDEFELALAREAIARDIPVLCICRGIQVLNVALGGTLIQDVADQYSDQIEHRQQKNEIPADQPSHTVSVEPDSLLAKVYGTLKIETNSFHHQALKDVSPQLRVVGHAPDETVEAVEHPGCSWLLAVQWHPEMMFRAHDEHLRPFQGLVNAAVARIEQHASVAAD